jgi:hypothetical protein
MRRGNMGILPAILFVSNNEQRFDRLRGEVGGKLEVLAADTGHKVRWILKEFSDIKAVVFDVDACETNALVQPQTLIPEIRAINKVLAFAATDSGVLRAKYEQVCACDVSCPWDDVVDVVVSFVEDALSQNKNSMALSRKPRQNIICVSDDRQKAFRLKGLPISRKTLVYPATTNKQALQHLETCDGKVCAVILDISAKESFGETLDYESLIYDLWDRDFRGIICSVSDDQERRENFETYFRLPSFDWATLTTEVNGDSPFANLPM